MSVLPDYTLSTQSALSKEASSLGPHSFIQKVQLFANERYSLLVLIKDLNTQEDLEKFQSVE